jgi:hypothetical protein
VVQHRHRHASEQDLAPRRPPAGTDDDERGAAPSGEPASAPATARAPRAGRPASSTTVSAPAASAPAALVFPSATAAAISSRPAKTDGAAGERTPGARRPVVADQDRTRSGSLALVG